MLVKKENIMSYRFQIFETVANWFRPSEKLYLETIPLPSGPVNTHDPLSNFTSDKNVLPPVNWHNDHHKTKSLAPSKVKFKK